MSWFKRMVVLGLWCLGLAIPSGAFAWNSVGHKVIATIAYRQLDPQTRQKIAVLLKKHPAYAELWAARAGDGADENLNLFWDASIFADEARRGPFEEFHRPLAHYVNFRVMAMQGNKIEPPVSGENLLNSYVAHVRKADQLKTPEDEKALHVSWIFHQAGDIHQPLHAVARFSKAFPQGDRGGNAVTFPNPRSRFDGPSNLHAYWDDLLGKEETPAAINRLADGIIAEHPRDQHAEELSRKNVREWALESAQLSVSTVYRNLDPNLKSFADIPIGYEADAMRAARTRIALAGYRLADELTQIFDESETISPELPAIPNP